MFVLSRNVSASFRVIATLVATAVVMWTLGVSHFAQAANITNLYDLLSDSAPAADSNHTIEFLAPSGVAQGETIVITFPAGFDLSTIGEDDVDLEINGVDAATAAAPAGATWGVTVAGQDLTIESGTGTIGGTATVTIKIGTHADGSGTGANQITNPSPAGGNGSYEIDISAGTSDSGHTRVVILDTVEVTASVNTSFTFTVTGTGNGTSVNTLTTNATSSSTTIPFGTLTAGVPVTLAQDLAVTTNAIHGFVVTVEEDQHLLSSTGADIDNFVDASSTDTPTAWAAPTNNIANENTWGHWGLTTEDNDTDGMRDSDEFGAAEFIGVSTTPRAIFAHDGPADGTTANIGATTVGFRAEISALQEAADDYTTTLTYIATPTF